MQGTQCLHQEEKDAPRPQRWWIRGASPVFSEGLRRLGKQASPVSHPEPHRILIRESRILIPLQIRDVPEVSVRSIARQPFTPRSTSSLNFGKMDCEPFLHGYGKDCSYAEVTIGIWDLCVIDMSGTGAESHSTSRGEMVFSSWVMRSITAHTSLDRKIFWLSQKV